MRSCICINDGDEETYPIAVEVELVDELDLFAVIIIVSFNNCIPLQLCHVIIMLSSLIYCKWRHCRFLPQDVSEYQVPSRQTS